MSSFLSDPRRFGQFIEYDSSGNASGFAEVALRHDYVNGTESSPVAFLEGVYVQPGARRSGVAKELVREAERWAKDRGCTELASDAELGNTLGHAMHSALGFIEMERVVFFRKLLR